jgi:O-acetylhomoserine (thiol)-lyase
MNPTVTALQERVNKMEQGLATIAFATGMAAIGTTMISLLKAGDHIVSSAFLFGNTNSLFGSLKRLGIEISFVDATDVNNVASAIQENTRLVFVETIANPVTQIADLAAIGDLCENQKLVYCVDNTMTSPYLFLPKTVNASLIVNSLTKYIGGHGNALGGCVTDTGLYDWSSFPNIDESYRNGDSSKWGITQIRKKGLRDFGASLGPEAAHSLAVGSETLPLRMERASSNALQLAEFCNNHPKIAKVYYPGLASHPQHDLAKQLFNQYGAIFSIDLIESVDCFEFLNRLTWIVSSSNLGDVRTLAIPVAHTIYYEMGAERRASMGIADSMIRFSVGIEEIQSLQDDLAQALA